MDGAKGTADDRHTAVGRRGRCTQRDGPRTAVVEAAADAHVAIEINAQPERLDLDWSAVKEHRDAVEYVVSTDAHTEGELDFLHLGVAQARRGWCAAGDVLNTRPLEELLSYIEG